VGLQDIFNAEFNLAFHQPKSDTCKKCDMFAVQKGLPSADRDKIEEDWNLQLHGAEETRAKLNADKDRARSDAVLMFTFDLQKTNPLPYLITNEAYYKRQLSVYSCGIHECGSDIGYFHMWHGATASRGPAEIASCIWQWLNEKNDEDKLKKEVVAYSDSCGGQNRNIVIATLWMSAVQEWDLVSVDHIFMVSGHSFLPCDEDFGVYEKEKRKNEQVYSFSEWVDVAKRARKKSSTFEVRELSAASFLNFLSYLFF